MSEKWYLMYDDNKIMRNIFGIDTFFHDISEIDIMTIKEKRNDFLKKIENEQATKLTDKNIYIVKVLFNSKENKYELKFYEPFFKPNLSESMYNKFVKVILLRLERIKNKDILNMQNNDNYAQFVFSFINLIISKVEMLDAIRSDLKNDPLEKNLYEAGKDGYVKTIINKLSYYTEIRKLMVSYSMYYDEEIKNKEKALSPYDYIYPARLFLLQGGLIRLTDANHMINDEECIKEEETFYTYKRDIKHEPFESEELAKVFYDGGVEAVMNTFEAEKLFSFSPHDLYKLGIIDDETLRNYYVKNKNKLNK